MSFVPSTGMLKKAQAGHYAIGAFNVENLEMVQAVIAAAEKMHAPVMIQTTPGTLKYAPPAAFASLVRALAEKASVPVAMHLDHGNSYELALACYEAGYTSLMIDGSLLPFEDNIVLTRRVVAMAGDLPVEAELGTVGGKEDTHSASIQYTDPHQAAEFVERTGITTFAPAIGTAHGVYKDIPRLDLDRLSEIRALVPVPLVLHGTSGVPDDTVRACIQRGICKVNYATDLRIAFTEAMRQAIAQQPAAIDPKKILAPAREAVMEKVCHLIEVCGCAGKADL